MKSILSVGLLFAVGFIVSCAGQEKGNSQVLQSRAPESREIKKSPPLPAQRVSRRDFPGFCIENKTDKEVEIFVYEISGRMSYRVPANTTEEIEPLWYHELTIEMDSMQHNVKKVKPVLVQAGIRDLDNLYVIGCFGLTIRISSSTVKKDESPVALMMSTSNVAF